MDTYKQTAILIAAIGLCAILSTGCAYQGSVANPLARKLSWYSYVNGDDLRATCEAGKANTLRLVYNAIHTEQIRTYEITILPDQDQSPLEARVLGPANLVKLGISDTGELIAPWMGDIATTHLRRVDVARLWRAMENSGAFDPAPEGLHLISEKFFWLTAICRDGRFFYNAYAWPSDRFDAITFDDLLFVWDMTEIAVNPPRQATMFDIYGDASPKKKTGAYYQITIGENGLKGLDALF